MLSIKSNKSLNLTLASFSVGALALCFVGCTGNTDGGDAATSNGDQFVAGDSNTGTISLDVETPDLQVSEVSSFRVRVKDASGNGVQNVSVSCDTEQGLALLEPTSGSELTDDQGQMSGKVGCAAPGSLRMGCRLPVGGNKRQFATIHCSGPIPTGFTGFAGAAGGGLGGGVDTSDNGGLGGGDITNGLKITAVDYLDLGPSSSGSTSVDVAQGLCGTGCASSSNSCTAEPFFDTYVQFTIVNNTNQTVHCSSYTYSVPHGLNATSGTVTSGSIAFTNEQAIASGGAEVALKALFLDVVSTSGCGGLECKTFYGQSSVIPNDFGFRNVSFRVSCSNDLGQSVVLKATQSASFDNFNAC